MKMRTIVILAGVVAGVAMGAQAPVQAADNFSFSFDTGNVAFAYDDGYWDTAHHWHRWHNVREARAYRERFADHYNHWRHDRDRDHGWHEDHHDDDHR